MPESRLVYYSHKTVHGESEVHSGTYHHALKWALFLSNAEGRLAKWRLRLAEIDDF